MNGQMNLFDFFRSSSFCWDDDINEIYGMLLELVKSFRMDTGKAEWKVWEHVPHFGYRMTFDIIMNKEQYTEDFLRELNKIVAYAEKKDVELSPFAPFFLGFDSGHMHIFSMFKDKKRQKIRL